MEIHTFPPVHNLRTTTTRFDLIRPTEPVFGEVSVIHVSAASRACSHIGSKVENDPMITVWCEKKENFRLVIIFEINTTTTTTTTTTYTQ